MNFELMKEFVEVVLVCDELVDVCVVFISGVGKMFLVGGDL